MEMQKEIRVICGTVQIPALREFLQTMNAISSSHGVIIQGLNAELIAGERHLHFAVRKALRAVAAGTNVAKDPGVEIMRYAAGERQIEKSFAIGLHEGDNIAAFVLLGKMEGVGLALSEIQKAIDEKPCPETLAYSDQKREGILALFGITEAEVEASGEDKIPELVLERIALADLWK